MGQEAVVRNQRLEAVIHTLELEDRLEAIDHIEVVVIHSLKEQRVRKHQQLHRHHNLQEQLKVIQIALVTCLVVNLLDQEGMLVEAQLALVH